VAWGVRIGRDEGNSMTDADGGRSTGAGSIYGAGWNGVMRYTAIEYFADLFKRYGVGRPEFGCQHGCGHGDAAQPRGMFGREACDRLALTCAGKVPTHGLTVGAGTFTHVCVAGCVTAARV